jgi:phospholipase B-like protein
MYHRVTSVFVLLICALTGSPVLATDNAGDAARLKPAYRFERSKWIYVHLEGSPADIGFQHGYLLSAEIADGFNAVKFMDTHRTKRDWSFFRDTAKTIIWPKVEPEYQEELKGIAEGLKAKGVAMDLWDVVALNAMEEVPDYYLPWLEHQQKGAAAPKLPPPGHCSAFVATGSMTKDHKPVIAHSNWTNFPVGSRWTIVFDIVPTHGYRIIQDGFPGIIVSDDDFGINSSGLMVTETTITGFSLFDPNGKPEFSRARKALQYANSIDEYVKIMLDGNNGGYANDWLLADNKTGEVARFELGLKMHKVWRTKDGFFVGANFPSDPEIIKKETDFNPKDMGSSMNARHVRWDQLMDQYKGQIDIEMAQKFLADHYDSYDKKEGPNERSLCGHIAVSPRGVPEWNDPPFEPGGAVTSQAADSSMAKNMSFAARAGYPCGESFVAEPYLKGRPEFEWERPVLQDMKGNPWAEFKAGEKPQGTD